MKKPKKFLKHYIVAIVVLVITQGCTPSTPLLNPITTNTFDVNLILPQNDLTYMDTSLVVDGDTLSFDIHPVSLFVITYYLLISTHSSNFEILNVKKYFYNNYWNVYDSTHSQLDVNTLSAGITIDNNYTTNPWQSFAPFNNTNASLSILHEDSDGFSAVTNGLRINTDEFFVLRKLIGTKYQYYWIRARVDGDYNTSKYSPKILDGKYQLNSIITGQ